MTELDEELPQGGVFTERTPVDPYLELGHLLRRPRSGFVPFDNLLLKAETFLHQESWLDLDSEWADLKQSFDRELIDIKDYLSWSSRFQEQTPEFVELMGQAFSILDHLEWQSSRMDEAISMADPVNWVFSLDQIDFSLKEFSALLQALREMEESQPEFSEIPYVQDLFRLAEAVRRGGLEADLLAERLVAYEEVQRFVHDSLHQQGGLSAGDLQQVDEAFALQNDGLDLLFAYLDCGKVSALDKGLALIQQAWENLLKVRQEMLMAQERAELPTCLRCGLLNPQGVRRCSACQARLPEQTSFQISLKDSQEARPMGPGLDRLTQAVFRMRSGEISLQQFADEVEDYRDLHRQASSRLAELEFSAHSLPSQEKADFSEARRLYALGMADLESGILQLEHFIEQQRHSRVKLEVPALALDRIQAGQDALLQLTALVNQL